MFQKLKSKIKKSWQRFKKFYKKNYQKNKVLTIILTILGVIVAIPLVYFIFLGVLFIVGTVLVLIFMWFLFRFMLYSSSSSSSSSSNYRSYSYDSGSSVKKETVKKKEASKPKTENNVFRFKEGAKFLRETGWSHGGNEIITAQQGLGPYNFVCTAEDFDKGKVTIMRGNQKVTQIKKFK